MRRINLFKCTINSIVIIAIVFLVSCSKNEAESSNHLWMWILAILFGLFLFRSIFKKSEAEKKYIGKSITCEVCGTKYYELNSPFSPELIPELKGKYYDGGMLYICTRCGRAYCSSCSMRNMSGCKCNSSGIFDVTTKHVAKKITDF